MWVSRCSTRSIPTVRFLGTNLTSLIDSNTWDKIQKSANEKQNQNKVRYDFMSKIEPMINTLSFHLNHFPSANLTPKFIETFELLQNLAELFPSNQPVRNDDMSALFDKYVQLNCYRHFLETKKLIPMHLCASKPLLEGYQGESSIFFPHMISDQEYISGIIGFCHDLSRFGMLRGTERDVRSVILCHKMAESILNKLMEFDFRNGPLRLKFDSLKYSVRNLEDIQYDLSLNGSNLLEEQSNQSLSEDNTNEHNFDEIEKIRLRMVEFDEKRETVIKISRDIQKASKNSIFAVHRGDLDRGRNLLRDAENITKKSLLPLLDGVPHLRIGSFSSAMEEFAEAKLFEAWISQRAIVPFHSLDFVNEIEYLGGLIDFTGEVGRYAIRCATTRDIDSVKACFNTNLAVHELISHLPFSLELSKKLPALVSNVSKIEKILYDLSLSQVKNVRIPDGSE